ncbi:MAG: arsenosugar biosynthesis radical SAM protein ArsS [Cyanobacteria bacterium]|nr:arsenosugar biosynthesis radical SAM protein ArsS [Cyanobacteriota bacterium]
MTTTVPIPTPSAPGRPRGLSPQQQRRLLQTALAREGAFGAALAERQLAAPRRSVLRVLQLNLGRLCNMQCSHCHVDAGPDQAASQMAESVVQQCLEAIRRLRPQVVDLTGGAPELHGAFRRLVLEARRHGCQVIDRSNLTVLLLPALSDLPAFLADNQVEIVASLPAAEASGTDAQRGEGTWAASITALRQLNQLGYGQNDPDRVLTLMSNPAGIALQQLTACDTAAWRRRLAEQGVGFDRLIGLNNMPIARFLQQLDDQGQVGSYLEQLHQAFNPSALCGLMCRDTLSVAPDGRLYDCDFNQMLEVELGAPADGARDQVPLSIDTVTREQLEQRAIAWGNHCFGCTAGQGSSCAGATASS